MDKVPGISFKISGPALSFLYYECDKSRMDQMGFLIGERYSYVKKTISDSDLNGEQNEIVYNINASLAVGLPFHFCNNVGRIDRAKLKELLGPLEKNVCGWYIFRRNVGLHPLLRDTIIHKELLACLPHVDPESFTMCCIENEVNTSKSTHRYKHVFLVYTNRSFLPISVSVTNLGQTVDSSYRTLSTSSTSTVNEIINLLKLDDQADGLSIMKSLQKPLQERIMQIATRIRQYDELAQTLENETDEIKVKKYKSLMFERANCDKTVRESPKEETRETDVEIKDHEMPLVCDKSGDEKNEDEIDNSEEVVLSSQINDEIVTSVKILHSPKNKDTVSGPVSTPISEPGESSQSEQY